MNGRGRPAARAFAAGPGRSCGRTRGLKHPWLGYVFLAARVTRSVTGAANPRRLVNDDTLF